MDTTEIWVLSFKDPRNINYAKAMLSVSGEYLAFNTKKEAFVTAKQFKNNSEVVIYGNDTIVTKNIVVLKLKINIYESNNKMSLRS